MGRSLAAGSPSGWSRRSRPARPWSSTTSASTRRPPPGQAIEAAGCHLRFLPASSPDFNPIEQLFSKLKTHLRGAAARAFDPLVDAIGEGLRTITSGDIAGYYRHCGYHLPPEDPVQPL